MFLWVYDNNERNIQIHTHTHSRVPFVALSLLSSLSAMNQREDLEVWAAHLHKAQSGRYGSTFCYTHLVTSSDQSNELSL